MKLVSIRSIGLIAMALCVSGPAFAHPGHNHSYANHRIYEMPPIDTVSSIVAGIVSIVIGLAILGWAINRRSKDS